jgi:hypothetical protein
VGGRVWGGSPCTAETLTCTVTRRVDHNCTPHPHQSSEPSEQQVHSKASLCNAVNAVQRCGVACVRTGPQGLEKRHDAQAACEPGGAEESLTILPDYTPTVRPPSKRS